MTLRKEIICILLDAGADPLQQSGFSGMRPHEAADMYKMDGVSDVIKKHKYHNIWIKVRKEFNNSSPSNDIEYIVKKFMDLFWRRGTVHWLFALARENMSNIKPHPKILENQKIYMKKFKGNISDTIEELFRDCVDRHYNMISCFDNLCK